MTDNRTTETMLDANYRQEAEEVLQFMDSLDTERKNGFLMFVRGARFMENLFSTNPVIENQP